MQLDELYRQVIMDHYMHPRNKGSMEGDVISIDLKNPTCGDEITLQLQVKDGVVEDVRFSGTGCSISMASASMMTEAVKGKSLPEALALSTEFRKLMKGQEVDEDLLGDLESLGGVSKFPARIKCATLSWNALERSASSLAE
ncbi:Fe-S cluster assembly sulfur transfer protein SufU [Ferroacidibacillus organovorans]|uniref:Iron-sulfur cluster assembly scaffold protein NifU n=1 Tax=Ferroacidibacillus organovorans TaxID=1765683 RepID=A0A162TKD4_9BACL|nr:SUF system NifU family Fe-S cluster assembly protein [Ferroacidibacillus organovorans]KYP80896.1 iron-sulfur cluster assembly scaffold protein NifU [Ferroacidibacillus organovorans]OAG95373.1 iron-sulfur cluster assembly scaffold protein NifU [Ferroacidibacillus organovorans]OPG15792.1 SUF system NifU family Fe-S cluster assembly protein [Ferroacidibacillus organovorans]